MQYHKSQNNPSLQSLYIYIHIQRVYYYHGLDVVEIILPMNQLEVRI